MGEEEKRTHGKTKEELKVHFEMFFGHMITQEEEEKQMLFDAVEALEEFCDHSDCPDCDNCEDRHGNSPPYPYEDLD